MPRVLIWDLPTRLFHLVFAGGIATAAILALVSDDDSAAFPHHALIGLTVAVALALRVVWGIVGSRHARFASFAFGPAEAIGYLRATLQRRSPRYAGHNPGAAHAAFAMYALTVLLTVSGVTLALGNGDAKSAHEVFAYAMLAVIAAHLAGLALHTATHREFIAASMVTGRKEADPADAIRSAHALTAIAFIGIVASFAVALWASYDASTRTARIPLVGTALAIGEDGHDRHQRHDDDGDDGDDD